MTEGTRSAPNVFPNTDRDWMVHAYCRQYDPELFFSTESGHADQARIVCHNCPVLTECRTYVLDNRIPSGVWAGLTEKQRRAIWARQNRNET